MTKLLLQALIVAGVLTIQASGFQQATTSPPGQPATAPTAPCTKVPPNPPHKQGWLEKKARALACQKDKSLCDLPSSPSDITGTTPDAKPCPATVPRNPAQAQAPSPATAPPAANNKPTYVCPPKTTLIPNTAYCLSPDHTTVDAIPLPPSLAAPTPAPKTPIQATQQQ